MFRLWHSDFKKHFNSFQCIYDIIYIVHLRAEIYADASAVKASEFKDRTRTGDLANELSIASHLRGRKIFSSGFNGAVNRE